MRKQTKKGMIIMGIFRVGNLRKTYYYFKKNGLKNAFYAAAERILDQSGETYRYEAPSDDALTAQREESAKYSCLFSILVPAYETKEEYLREMIDSVLNQSYQKFELILADAGRTDRVRKVAEEYADSRIRYIPLEENKGIAENTNAALARAKGDYVGLLDHDDVLTRDALFEMAKAVYESGKKGNTACLLYSDEDKGNGNMTVFYEPHRKPGLNPDLLFSNNYICHFLVMKRELMQRLRLRKEYDGAQDYDLILRAVGELLYGERRSRGAVVHVPKILYHWRCHEDSTAENPKSKEYAYEAGKRALEDFMQEREWRGSVCHTRHLGFYRIEYENHIFAQRKDAGVVGGKLIDKRGRISGGIYNARGKCPYLGLNRNFSGYMHRTSLCQEAYAVDLRCMRVRKELWGIFEDVFGISYREINIGGHRQFPYDGEYCYPWKKEKEAGEKSGEGTDGGADQRLADLCMEFGRRVRKAGYTVIWMPDWERRNSISYKPKKRKRQRGNGENNERSYGYNGSDTEL